MKVAFFTYPAAFQNVGGGEIQLLKTKEAIERVGQPVVLFDPWRHRVEEFDLLHVFSSVKDCVGVAQIAKTRGVKVVTSPVLWSDWRRAWTADGGWRERADLVARHAMKAVFPRFPSGRRRLLALSDRLFPNSEAEKRQIHSLFAIPLEKIDVVPNGVDPDFARADAGAWRSRHGDGPFLLSVGRIEPRKNQLNLIRAAKTLSMPLVLIGSPVSGYEEYADACRKTGEGFVRFVETMPHGDPLLKSAYAACSLFVLPGWFETPGLAGLEAALAGARLAVTSGGSTREYFEEDAVYLDPSNPALIHDALKEALGRQPGEKLKKRILDRFTWDRVAERTLTLYRDVLGKKAS